MEEAKTLNFPTRFPKINSNDRQKSVSDHERTFRRWKKLQRSSISASREKSEGKVENSPHVPKSATAVLSGLLALIARKAIVEVLARRRLVPLCVGLLTTTVAAGARGTTVSHGLSAVSGRRLGLGPSVAWLLAWAVRTCRNISHRPRRKRFAGAPTTTVLIKVG